MHTHTTQPSVWQFVEPDPSSNLQPVLLFLQMLYFSTSTATLCGTSLIEPIEWYAELTVSLQVAITYHVTPGSCVASNWWSLLTVSSMLLGNWVDGKLYIA